MTYFRVPRQYIFPNRRNVNLVSRARQRITYDPERRPVKLTCGGATLWRAPYDGDGTRRKRLDQHGTTHYLGACEPNVGTGQDTAEVVTKQLLCPRATRQPSRDAGARRSRLLSPAGRRG